MPEELKQRVPHDVRLYVRNFWQHPEDPNRSYDFYDGTGEKYFYYLTDENGPLNPDEWGDIVVLLFARGCLKTTTCTMIANWAADCYSNTEGLVTAPRQDQTQEVMGRIKQAVEESGLAARRDKDKETHQRFRNEYTDNTGEQRTSYSEIKSRSSWGDGDALRGIHAHYGIVDEFQDVDEGMFSVFLETVDRRLPQVDYFPTIFVIGTPKMANSFFHRLWNMSDQRKWDDENKTWVKSSQGKEYLPEAAKKRRRELEQKIEALKYDEEQNGVDHSQSIAAFEEELDEISGFRVTGWHIDQYACPRHSPQEIAFKKAEYPKRKFRNEVEAKFYSPENDLLTKEDALEAIDEDEGWFSRPIHDDTDVFIGVDWGGGDGEGAASTSITIGELLPEGDIQVLKHEFLPHDLTDSEEVERIEEYIMKYQESGDRGITVVDEGYGDTNRSNLQQGVGTHSPTGYDNVYGCMYGNVNKKDGVTWSRKGTKDYFTVNRTFMIESFCEDFKRGRIKIPGADLEYDGRSSNGSRLIDNLTAPYTDRVETADGKKKLRVISDDQDDALHSFVYMWIAANHVRSRRQVRTVGSHGTY